MTEELYRAKRLDNNEWVYWTSLGKFTQTQYGKLISGSVGHTDWTFEILTHPGTQSRTIGKKDRSNNEIFGGDIVRHYNDSRNPEQYHLGIIEWDPTNFRWVIRNLFEDKCYQIGAHCTYEVIGNIVDHKVTKDLQIIPRNAPPPTITDE